MVDFIRQPNGYTCGTTALYIACKAKNIKCPELLVLANEMGTNSLTGTTDIEMAKGLNIVGLPVNRYILTGVEELTSKNCQGPQHAFNSLSGHIKNGGMFLLRGLMGMPHWILAYNVKNDTIEYMCSVSGVGFLNDKELYKVWEPRNFDGFRI